MFHQKLSKSFPLLLAQCRTSKECTENAALLFHTGSTCCNAMRRNGLQPEKHVNAAPLLQDVQRVGHFDGAFSSNMQENEIEHSLQSTKKTRLSASKCGHFLKCLMCKLKHILQCGDKLEAEAVAHTFKIEALVFTLETTLSLARTTHSSHRHRGKMHQTDQTRKALHSELS